MPQDEPDLRLDGFQPANKRVAERFWQHIASEQDQLTVLAAHHTDDLRHSYFVLHNAAVTWGIPGEPQIVALRIHRDTREQTFRFSHAELPLPVMAQSWLIARGCPEDAILLPEGMGPRPADNATRTLEERLRDDGDHFAFLHSYTSDTDPLETTVLLRALDERAPAPFRVLLEEVDVDTWTRTLREGSFATLGAATDWWERHWNGESVPLPNLPPEARRVTSQVPGLPAGPVSGRGPRR